MVDMYVVNQRKVVYVLKCTKKVLNFFGHLEFICMQLKRWRSKIFLKGGRTFFGYLYNKF